MNELTLTFQFEATSVRTMMIETEPWFVGIDVASALGYSNTRDALARHVDDEDKATVAIHDGSQNRNMTIINEPGVYSLIFSSQLKSAKQFKQWVTHEVLPSIRKQGFYSTMSDDDLVQFITERQKLNPATLDLIDKPKIKNQIKQEVRNARQEETVNLWVRFFGRKEEVDVPKELRHIWRDDMPMYHKYLDKYHVDLNKQKKGHIVTV